MDAILRSTYEWTTSGRIFQVFLIKGRVTFSAAGASLVLVFFYTHSCCTMMDLRGGRGKRTRFE